MTLNTAGITQSLAFDGSQESHGGSTARCVILEVLGLGVTYDKYRQEALWDALKKGTAFSAIRDVDLASVPWSRQDKYARSGKRAVDAFENAVTNTPMYWGVPSMYAGIPLSSKSLNKFAGPVLGLTGSAEHNGFSWHLFVASDWLLSESPDRLFELAFQFFDKNRDAPLLFVSAVDAPDDHDREAPPGAPRLLRDGRYLIDLPDAAVVLVLGRRDRVTRLRQFAWDDKDNDFGQNKIRRAYYDLRSQLAKPEGHHMRDLSVDEWLAETARLAGRDDIRSGWGNFWTRKGWVPSPWFPVPWSKEQLDVFDRLPTLGYIHRPVFVEWKDREGHVITGEEQRSIILKEGLDRAISESTKAPVPQYPKRLVIATGDHTERALVLHSALSAQKAEGGPVYEITDKTGFIDTDKRLGNTGSATFFMQAAIGIMGSYREGGVSAAISMRDPNGASIMLISPPTDELRAKQTHPAGGDVFRHKVEPAYDPEAYKQ
jgi:hypothetical protein